MVSRERKELTVIHALRQLVAGNLSYNLDAINLSYNLDMIDLSFTEEEKRYARGIQDYIQGVAQKVGDDYLNLLRQYAEYVVEEAE